MSVISSVSATQASTNTSAIVMGSILNAWQGLAVSYTIINTGDDTISYIVYAGNDASLEDAVIIQASADILSGAAGSYSAFIAPFAYYGIYVESKVDGSHGEATVKGVVKG